ncbi:MAG: hypothetical protein WCJ92_05560 [Alphaproteobacteria bacterium]
MKISSSLSILVLCSVFLKILGAEIDENDIIIISRKPTEIIHINPLLTITDAESRALVQLTENLKHKRFNQYQVDAALSNAALHNHRCIMNFLLTPSTAQLRPGQPRINQVLWNAVIADNFALVKFFINLGEEQLRPDQWGMNEALWLAVIYGREPTVKCLLNRDKDQLRPDKNGIGHAHKKAITIDRPDIIEIISLYAGDEQG